MNPTLSVIITNRNYTHDLPRLFASIEEQTFKDFEVLIVDDCSDEPCDEIVANYQRKGMAIQLIQGTERLFVKNSRVLGVEASKGKIISFIDADDCLIDKHHFMTHVAMMESENADIVHFKTKILNAKCEPIEGSWEDPVIEGTLEGPQIFDTLTNSPAGKTLSMGVADKFWKKELFMRCLPVAKKSKVRRCSEDTFFNLMLLPIAQKYVGSSHSPYGYIRTLRGAGKTMGTVASLYYALCDVPPFLIQNDCPEYIVEKCKNLLYNRLYTDISRFCDFMIDKKTGLINETKFLELQNYHDIQEYLYILLRGAPIERINQKKAEVEALKAEEKYLHNFISKNMPLRYRLFMQKKQLKKTSINFYKKTARAVKNSLNRLQAKL